MTLLYHILNDIHKHVTLKNTNQVGYRYKTDSNSNNYEAINSENIDESKQQFIARFDEILHISYLEPIELENGSFSRFNIVCFYLENGILNRICSYDSKLVHIIDISISGIDSTVHVYFNEHDGININIKLYDNLQKAFNDCIEELTNYDVNLVLGFKDYANTLMFGAINYSIYGPTQDNNTEIVIDI